MANTYIHTLPDSLESLDPASFTILDTKNIYDEYTTSKLKLSSLTNYVNNEYIITEEHLSTKRATSWVNLNSSNISIQTLFLSNSFTNIPLKVESNINDSSLILIKNINLGNNNTTELNFENSLSSERFRIGVLGENYINNIWTIGEAKNDAYVITEDKNLIIGSQGTDKNLILFSNGPFSGNERIVIKGDGSGRIGINTINPNAILTINGTVSSNDTFFSKSGNSEQWNSVYSYVFSVSSPEKETSNFIQNVSSNLVFRTGSLITGTLNTTQTLTSFFSLDDFITRRYVDAVLLQSTVSGNFIPALYYTKTDTDALLISPNSVYSHVNLNSSLDLNSRLFVNNNSSIFLNLNTLVNTASANWNSVYSFVNQASAAEQGQNEVVTFILSNSSNIVQVNTKVNNTSASWDSVYSNVNLISSLDTDVRTYVNQNSAAINNNLSLVNDNAGLWSQAYSYANASSAQNTSTNTLVNSNSANWNQSYTLYSNNSGTYTTYNYVNNNFLPLSGGKVIGSLFATNYGVGNTIVVAGTLGTLSRKMEIFDINGNSLGFIPVYGSIT
jgi:hypothetical protein